MDTRRIRKGSNRLVDELDLSEAWAKRRPLVNGLEVPELPWIQWRKEAKARRLDRLGGFVILDLHTPGGTTGPWL